MYQRMETHCHSDFSNIRLLDSINRPKDLILTAHNLGLSGICLTDHEAVCGAVEWLTLEKELKEKEKIPEDFKCGIGNEIYLIDKRAMGQKYYHFILIAKDTIGFRQLCELSSNSWYNSYFDRGMERVPTLKSELKQIVEKNKGHLIATTACIGGELASTFFEYSKNGDESAKDRVINFLEFCLDLFGDDFYIETAPACSEDQILFNKWIKKFCKRNNLKMIFGTDAHYLTKDYRQIHKAYLNSKEGEREVDDFYAYSHLMDTDEAMEYFTQSDYDEEDVKKMCENSMEIYDKIKCYDIFRNPIIPQVDVKNYKKQKWNYSEYPTLKMLFESDNVQERYWVNECWNGLVSRNLVNEKYLSRLEIEADIINTVGNKLDNCMFEYFNTFQHFIDLFWECGSLSGPGRGSSVCFLSNYLLGITQLDPLEWNLAEWRFLNKDRLELPDIDTDLSPTKRPLIFKKMREERGELRVLQVATFGTEGTKSAILAACRGYRSEKYPEGIDVDEAQYISGLIPSERGFLWTLKDMYYGSDDGERQPNKTFIDTVNKYPNLFEIMQTIEGLRNKRSQHASGVILYNEDPWCTGAVMRSPNGDLTTQFSLHDTEKLGDTKFDFLVTDICDKITLTINQLQDNGYFKEKTLREVYEKYLHPSMLDLTDERLWDKLDYGNVISLFQFDSPVGAQGIKAIKPRTPIELMMTNALIRLTGEKGAERPMDRYVKMKNNIQLWYNECKNIGLTDEEIKTLEKYYIPVSGCPTTQEKLMLLCMDKDVANFTLKEANAARKICAKKKLKEIPALKEKFINGCPRPELGEYVWRTAIEPQMSYAFAEPHALAYSFIAIQILYLVVNYPEIYWNTACLICDSGGNEEIDLDIDNNENEEEDSKKKTTEYGKIAQAIGKYKTVGINVLPPNINTSSFTFTADEKKNTITYGLRGITRIGSDIIKEIILNRPYSTLKDFTNRLKIDKIQIINLIKSGAFDEIEKKPREEILRDYIYSFCDTKEKLTMQNMNSMIKFNIIPEDKIKYEELFNFNKFLKTKKTKDGLYYSLTPKAIDYICNIDADLITDGNKILIKTWDKAYAKLFTPFKDWLKDNMEDMLKKYNDYIVSEQIAKYANGNISHWEMEALSFYSHPHELSGIGLYSADFNSLSEEPTVLNVSSYKGSTYNIYETTVLAGTVIDKNKLKNTVTLLTPSGVVNLKLYKNLFSDYDKQLSIKNPDGSKTILEKSWFSRGTLLYVQGYRRGDVFVIKKPRNSMLSALNKVNILPDGGYAFIKERVEV